MHKNTKYFALKYARIQLNLLKFNGLTQYEETLIIRFLWGSWHLPLIIFLPKAVGHMPVLAYIPLMTAMEVIFSWLYNRTKGSVLLAILLHGRMNFTHGFLGADILGNKSLLIIQVGLIVILAIIVSQSNRKVQSKGSLPTKS